MKEDFFPLWIAHPPLGPLSSAALYPPLIATLVALTSPPFDPPPEIIIAYKVYLSL